MRPRVACGRARTSRYGQPWDAAQQCVVGVFIPVGAWRRDGLQAMTGLLVSWPAPLGRHFELFDERCEMRRHRLRYSVVLDPEPSPNCQQPHPSI